MKVKFDTQVVTTPPEGKVTITLPRHAEIFDIVKTERLSGIQSFKICYSYDSDLLAYEQVTLHMIRQGDTTEEKHKLRYIGKYFPKFQDSLVFVFVQVSP